MGRQDILIDRRKSPSGRKKIFRTITGLKPRLTKEDILLAYTGLLGPIYGSLMYTGDLDRPNTLTSLNLAILSPIVVVITHSG